jgi:hypothetical protein
MSAMERLNLRSEHGLWSTKHRPDLANRGRSTSGPPCSIPVTGICKHTPKRHCDSVMVNSRYEA